MTDEELLRPKDIRMGFKPKEELQQDVLKVIDRTVAIQEKYQLLSKGAQAGVKT